MNNKRYWKDREEQQQKIYLKDEAAYAKELQRMYASLSDSIEKEINSFYAKYASKEGISIAEAKKRASKLDIEAYSRKAKKYVKTKDFSKQANDEMRIYNATMKINRLELLKAMIGLELINTTQEAEQFLNEKVSDRAMEEYKRQAGILGETIMPDVVSRAHTLVNASFHNATFSQRIWSYQDIMRQDLSNILTRGFVQGKNPRALASEIRKYLSTDGKSSAAYNTERLMRTEMARVQTAAQMDSFKTYGYTKYEYIAIGNDGKTCPICKELDGKVFRTNEAEVAVNYPPMHPNCRCSVAAVFEKD